MRKIREMWDNFCTTVEADPKHVDEIFGWLDRFYNEPGRHYHNWTHIESCINQLHEVLKKTDDVAFQEFSNSSIAESGLELEYALWFHDVIYSFGFQYTDEEASAKLACICAEKLKITGKIDMFVVSSLITLTKDHEPEIRPYIGFKEAQNLMVDIDLSIFSEDEKIVKEYDEAIRNEYFWVPFDDFSRGRVQALKKYYYRDSVYFSPWFKDRNRDAKGNLKRLIDKYGS